MSEYQIVSWHDIPSLVVARSGDVVVKVSLPPLFQEAIDEAAMRLGKSDADAYIAGWARGAWLSAEGNPHDVANSVSESIINEFSPSRMAQMLDAMSEGTAE
jgi:hypothetical protein